MSILTWKARRGTWNIHVTYISPKSGLQEIMRRLQSAPFVVVERVAEREARAARHYIVTSAR